MKPPCHQTTPSWVAAILVAVVISACSPTPRPEIPVILISIDTLRADHLGCYGYERDTSPAIDALARDSIRFSRAFSQSSWTLPSHVSLMTSQYPSTHRVTDDRFALPEEATTLADALQGAGYHTAGFVTWIYVSEVYGFAQGFDEFRTLIDRPQLEPASGRGAFPAQEAVSTVKSWLTQNQADPFFLFVHLFDPHMDYDPPAPYDTLFDPEYEGFATGQYRWMQPYIAGLNEFPLDIRPRDREHVEALYDGEIRYVDRQIEGLLTAIDEAVGLDRCLVILTSDHGEEFGEHGSMEGHGWTLYDEIVHVPLLVRLPARDRAGTTVDLPVELIDVAPTILAQLGLKAPDPFQGHSLLVEADGGPKVAYCETDRFNVIKRVVRGASHKLIHTRNTGRNAAGVPIQDGYELYDLEKDPGETQNLYDPQSPIAIALTDLLARHAAATTGAQPPPPSAQLSPADIELLRSLGYVQ